MKIDEVKSILEKHGLVVCLRATEELFPFAKKAKDPIHSSVVCKSHADQRRVHHWIEFYRDDFEGFDLWAAYVEAIVAGGIYSGPQPPPLPKLPELHTAPPAPPPPSPLPSHKLTLPPGVVC